MMPWLRFGGFALSILCFCIGIVKVGAPDYVGWILFALMIGALVDDTTKEKK